MENAPTEPLPEPAPKPTTSERARTLAVISLRWVSLATERLAVRLDKTEEPTAEES